MGHYAPGWWESLFLFIRTYQPAKSRRVEDERYIGRRTVNGEVVENDHDAIIDPELYARVQALREISWNKQAKRLATNRAKWEETHGKNSDSPAADD